MSKSYDLSTSSKWSALSDGEHTVQIVAKGTGYRDSAKSTSVTVTKGGSTGETWILNLSIHPGSQSYNFAGISFTSNNQKFDRLYYNRVYYDSGTLSYFLNETEKEIYSFNDGSDIWLDGEAYRIITFETAPTGDLLAWLQENGMKQDGPLINFTIDGTSYQAGQGMTWNQWVETPYNTDDFSVDLGDNTVRNGTNFLYTSSNMQLVLASNTIISGGAYTFASGGAGN